MRNLSDKIERYLKVLIERSDDQQVEIQRAELAETFQCAPSQITYVLGTRFTVTDGFTTRSKRGGGGYIRIQKMPVPFGQAEQGLTGEQARDTVEDLEKKGLLSPRMAGVVEAIMEKVVAGRDVPDQEFLRRQIIEAILCEMEGKDHEL